MTIDDPAAMELRAGLVVQPAADALRAERARDVPEEPEGRPVERVDLRVERVDLQAVLVGRAHRESRVAGQTGRVATATHARIGRAVREMPVRTARVAMGTHVRTARVAMGTHVLRARDQGVRDLSAADDLIVRELRARAVEHPARAVLEMEAAALEQVARVGIRSAAHPLAVKDAATRGVNAILN